MLQDTLPEMVRGLHLRHRDGGFQKQAGRCPTSSPAPCPPASELVGAAGFQAKPDSLNPAFGFSPGCQQPSALLPSVAVAVQGGAAPGGSHSLMLSTVAWSTV